MHRVILLAIDVLLIVVSTVFALALRENLDLPIERIVDLGSYILLTVAVSVPVLLTVGLNRTLWRFSSMEDFLWVIAAAVIIVVLTVAVGFAINRLEGVARSLPILQGLIMVCALAGVRVAMRLRHVWRARRPATVAGQAAAPQQEAVLVVGLNAVTELFLQSVQEFAGERVKVVGILGRGERHRGRLLRLHTVLGLPEEIDRILGELEVHGIMIQRIVIATQFDTLSSEAQGALLRVERTSDIELDFFAERVVLNRDGRRGPDVPRRDPGIDQRVKASLKAQLVVLAARPYCRTKRLLDVVFAAALLAFLAPVLVALGIIVTLSIGPPPLFWQQRPGWMGRPFRLFKFRTMRPAHDAHGNRISDAKRTPRVGHIMRRTRLDELPQLYSVFLGEMSFVGPRPLLPIDQAPGSELRFAVRPGLTGWAQIKGGRELTASDKAALDVWYVRHASLAVDLKILAGTLSMLVFGEKVDRRAILMAREELSHYQPQLANLPHYDHNDGHSSHTQKQARDYGGAGRFSVSQAHRQALARRRI